MATLAEIMNSAFAGEEKTAQEQQPAQEHTAEEIEKVATSLGIYDLLFPEDSQPAEKTAEEKQAAAEEALGARAYDYFAARLNSRIEKLAGEIMSAADMEAAQGIMQPAARPPQAVPTNQDPVGDKVPMSPVKETPYSVVAGQEAGAEGQVGLEQQQKMAAAVQKHLLKRALGI